MSRARKRDRLHLCPPWHVPVVHVLVLILAGQFTLAGLARGEAQKSVPKPTVSDGASAKAANPKTTGSKAPATKSAAKKPATAKRRPSAASQSIVALVNDDPITGYEIEQRVGIALQRHIQKKLSAPGINEKFKAFAIKRLKANPPKSEAEQVARLKQLQGQFKQSIRNQVRTGFGAAARKKALDELIDVRLKLQEAKRLNLIASKAEVDAEMAKLAKRNKVSPAEFAKRLKKMGADISAIEERYRTDLSWINVIRARFGRQVNVAKSEVNRLAANTEGEDGVELRLHRIMLAIPSNDDQKRMAQRLREAESLRSKFTDCKGTSALATGVQQARFQDLGNRRPASIPEPTRSLLLIAGDEEMLPPRVGEGGVELWAVCGRKVIKADQTKRSTAQRSLVQEKFLKLAERHLKDLRLEAHIEYR